MPAVTTLSMNWKKFSMLFFALVAGFVGGWAGSRSDTRLGTNTSTQEKIQVVSSESQLISQIAKEVGQSVVSINVSANAGVDFFGGVVQQQGAGTGMIISSDGYIMTNRHVVANGTTSVSVTTSDGTKYDDVEIIGRDTANDIAFLKVKNPKDFKAVKLGDSTKVQVGDKVIAIGNAQGQFQNTVTSGIISGIGRDITAGDSSGDSEPLRNLIQTDAAINQGNSGGPLVSLNGEVIGMNTAVAGSAENLGFAIPITDAQGIIKTVLEKGRIIRPYLGVRYVVITDDIAYEYNLPVKRGAYLAPSRGQTVVLPDSPAAKAGLKEKDIITKIGDTAIDEKTSLTTALSKYQVGDTVKVTINRDGKEQTVDAKLEEAKAQ